MCIDSLFRFIDQAITFFIALEKLNIYIACVHFHRIEYIKQAKHEKQVKHAK
jgi:hypothetical protein